MISRENSFPCKGRMAVEEEIDSALSDRKGSKCDAVLSYLNSLNEEETFLYVYWVDWEYMGPTWRSGDIFWSLVFPSVTWVPGIKFRSLACVQALLPTEPNQQYSSQQFKTPNQELTFPLMLAYWCILSSSFCLSFFTVYFICWFSLETFLVVSIPRYVKVNFNIWKKTLTLVSWFWISLYKPINYGIFLTF